MSNSTNTTTSNTRLYKVSTPHGARLVEARTRRQAIVHVMRVDRSRTTADLAHSHEVHALAKSGVEIEIAGDVSQLSEATQANLAQGQLDV